VTLSLPTCSTLDLRIEGGVLHLTFNRPEVRNALSTAMWQEIAAVFTAIADDRSIRAVVLRGSGGTFCAGGDMKERATITAPSAGEADPMWDRNRMGGHILQQIDSAPQLVISVVEGAAVGGGMGLVCVSDVTLALADAKFALPEVSLGILPAQLSPFITRRLGFSQARRLALTAATLRGSEACVLGLVHRACDDAAQLDAALTELLTQVARCAPGAIAGTKRLIALTGTIPLEQHLDRAADAFVTAVRSAEGTEGAAAFAARRSPNWQDAR